MRVIDLLLLAVPGGIASPSLAVSQADVFIQVPAETVVFDGSQEGDGGRDRRDTRKRRDRPDWSWE